MAQKDHPYDESAIARAADLLGSELARKPLAERVGPVFEMRLRNQASGADVVVTLWPALRRVDARIGDVFATVKEIGRVTLEPGVEAVFWKEPGPGYLLVTVKGKVSVSG